ncbi:MAG: ABC transporter permease [Caldicoprobacterales bacterium]|jgi:ABC-2 type transport system permease protein
MQVYKALFKVIKKNLPQIMIYIVVFVAVAVGLSFVDTNPTDMDFTETKVNIAFINHDKSALSEGLKNHLSKSSNIIELPDDAEKLQDALFFREVEYIVRIPKDFANHFIEGKSAQIEKTAVPGSISEVYLDNVINKYINTAKIYAANIEGLSDQQLVDYVENDMEQNVEVKMNRTVGEVSLGQKVSSHFNYIAYSLFAVLILGVSVVMLVFNDKDLKNRNLCSPITLRSMNFQLILGNLSYAVLAWAVMILPSLIMFGSFMFTTRGVLLLLNSFVFTVSALSISFLISISVSSPGAVSAAANVVSLGTSFISGVFVPQELLSDTVLRVASFTPNYWFVKTNNTIAGMADVTLKSITPLFYNMLIILGFAFAALAVALVVTKQKRMSN